MKIETVGYAVVDGFGDLDVSTIRSDEKSAIEAWVRIRGEIKGEVAEQAIDALWHGYAQQWGAQVVPIEIASEGDVTLKQAVFQKLDRI